jgi:hypothetical protein
MGREIFSSRPVEMSGLWGGEGSRRDRGLHETEPRGAVSVSAVPGRVHGVFGNRLCAQAAAARPGRFVIAWDLQGGIHRQFGPRARGQI